MSISVSRIKAANTPIMYINDQINLQLPVFQDHNLLLFHSRSHLGDGNKEVANVFADYGGQYLHYLLKQWSLWSVA